MPSHQPNAFSGHLPQGGAPAGPRWASLAAALFLVACVHSPQAAVLEPDRTLEYPVAAPSCSGTPAARAALQSVGQELEALGMVLNATCPSAGGGWVVQLRVVDGMKASKVVRGPLADGHEVDMGTPSGVALAGAEPTARSFSPDVQHNRQWLRATMARHQFDPSPDAWWRFALRGTVPARPADADFAVR